jgi:hypothetical protein
VLVEVRAVGDPEPEPPVFHDQPLQTRSLAAPAGEAGGPVSPEAAAGAPEDAPREISSERRQSAYDLGYDPNDYM